MEQNQISNVRRCVCGNLRLATRALSQLYDEALQPAGIRTTQFTVLFTIATNSAATVSELADKLIMDRTTMTRNLQALQKQGLIESTPGKDQRTKVIKLTEEGVTTLEKALPLWNEAQEQVVNGLGQDHFRSLLKELSTVVALAR